MIIGYARVSTQDQNPQLQRDALEEAGCEQVFEERVTGTKRERPELQACLRTLRDGDTLVVWKLDRLARSLKDLMELIHDLNERGVGFRSLTEAIDTTSAGGKLVFHIFGALAEFEHSLIRERTLAGLAAARARGRKGGRRTPNPCPVSTGSARLHPSPPARWPARHTSPHAVPGQAHGRCGSGRPSAPPAVR